MGTTPEKLVEVKVTQVQCCNIYKNNGDNWHLISVIWIFELEEWSHFYAQWADYIFHKGSLA
jgi:hypothetical protein